MTGAARRAELAVRLDEVEQRIREACAAAGRDRAEVTLIAITKTFPASDVELLHDLGVGEIGENRDQEATAKRAELAARGFDPDRLAWHFVGGLQSNKCRSVARYARMVHSVDRVRLVDVLGTAARAAGRVVDCLVQVDLDPLSRPGRSGVPAAGVPAIAHAVVSTPGLNLAGVMAVAPLDADPQAAFRDLAAVAAALREAHPGARVVSAGMSADLEAAIAAGSTHLRVGAALLGSRAHPG